MADTIGDQDRYIHLKEISVDFIKRRPTSVLELVFKDDTGVKHKSNKFKEGDAIHWNIDKYIRNQTRATLTIRRAPFNIQVAETSIEPNEFRDGRAFGLQGCDSDNRVTVNFVCGRSQSFADVACVRTLDAQERHSTSLVPMVLRFLKLPQLAVLPPPISEQECHVLYAAIHRLNDDILLDIFDCYRLGEMNGWNVRLGWRKLSQVCQRWRHLIYKSTFHLGMHIRCTNGTPIVDTLHHLPPLPLCIGYKSISEQDESGIYQALQLHDRVHHIHLVLPPSVMDKCLKLIGGHFPILENLSLSADGQLTNHTLPMAFMAPNLRRLDLTVIGLPKRLRLLTFTASLVTLVLRNIQGPSYFSPRLLVARLSSLPRLQELSIGFSIPIPRPSTEREQLGEQRAPVTLPNLKYLSFKGVGAYLDSLVAQIRAPLLEKVDITLFNQIAFALPHLWHLINSKEKFQMAEASVSFLVDAVFISTSRGSRRPMAPTSFCLRVKCKQLDWQIDCAAQIYSALIPILSGVEHFTLNFHQDVMPKEFENGEIDSVLWHELLRSFIGVKVLFVSAGLLQELSCALKLDEVGSDPGFLPDLRYIVTRTNHFSSFIDTRRVVGRPVKWSSSLKVRRRVGLRAHEWKLSPQPPSMFDPPRFPRSAA